MNVDVILKAKALAGHAPAVVTANAETPVSDIIKTLASHNVGAVVIVGSDHRVAGIVSERDIVRQIARAGASVLDGAVSEIMTRGVITCSAIDSIDHVMSEMTRGRFRHVPVLGADRRLIGLVSIGDVVKFHVEEIEHEASALRSYVTSH